jgi:DNA-directed RNA polymerase subunit M/transcription elongation factor TFIIS
MQFCSECHNMYYLKIQDEDGVIGNTLIYYCRNCGHEDKTLSTTNICVSDIQLRTSEKKYTHIVNEYTKYDPTLPRINTIKCPNQDCVSNGTGTGKSTMKGGAGKSTAGKEEEGVVKKTARIPKATTGRKTKAQKEAEAAQLEAASQLEAAAALHSVNQSVVKAQASAAQAEATLAIAEADLLEEEAQEEPNVQPKTNNREVIYIRYDDTNMKYVYLCAHCDTTWRTDNRL